VATHTFELLSISMALILIDKKLLFSLNQTYFPFLSTQQRPFSFVAIHILPFLSSTISLIGVFNLSLFSNIGVTPLFSTLKIPSLNLEPTIISPFVNFSMQ